MIKDNLRFSKELKKINDWWLTGKLSLPKLLNRESLKKTIEEIENKRVIQILGPRRVGKTTLIKQVISNLLSKGIPARNILYLSLDDPLFYSLSDNVLDDTLNFFLENISPESRTYVFLDEIHTYRDWYKWIKSFYDKYAHTGKMKFIISGSSSLTLQKEANLYLRGRTIDIELWPFSFKEFLEFNGVKIENITFDALQKYSNTRISSIEKKIKRYFKEYILIGGFPEWFEIRDVKKWFEKILNDIPKKAVYEDVVNIFNIRSPKILENILAFIVENQSQVLSYEKINEIAELQRSILLNYIEYLKNSYLVIEIQRFAKKIKERLKSKKKYLCIDQGIRNALLKEYEIKQENIGSIIENVVGIHIYRQNKEKTYYYKTDEEIDFIIQKDNELIPVEAKFRESVELPKGMMKFINVNKAKSGFVITKNLFKKNVNSKIHFIPAWLFLLMEI